MSTLQVGRFFRFDRNITCLETIPSYAPPPLPGLAREPQRDLQQEALRISPHVQAMFILSAEYPD
ncbi:hypothetical protein K501DRAFT_283406, partial [Backusella circina FSU 941]